MPLFGPNIKKMKEQGDIHGLMKELENKKYEVRIDVVEALKDLKNVEGLSKALKNDMPGVCFAACEALKEIGDPEGLSLAAQFLIKMLKYGSDEDKIEAITRICGHVNTLFLTCWLGSSSAPEVLKSVIKAKLPLELVRDHLLLETSYENVHPVVRWYALVALVELGDRSSDILTELIELGDKLVAFYDREPEPNEDSFGLVTRTFFAISIKDETLRALSHFKNNPVVTSVVLSALEGQILAGRSKGEQHFDDKHILSALGAIGDPRTKERLEYLANYRDAEVRRLARIALDLFGKATYDEIKARMEKEKSKA